MGDLDRSDIDEGKAYIMGGCQMSGLHTTLVGLDKDKVCGRGGKDGKGKNEFVCTSGEGVWEGYVDKVEGWEWESGLCLGGWGEVISRWYVVEVEGWKRKSMSSVAVDLTMIHAGFSRFATSIGVWEFRLGGTGFSYLCHCEVERQNLPAWTSQ